jgi:hypothetical protein
MQADYKRTLTTGFFIALFILYLLPVVLLRENAFIFIHDNLDGEFSWRVALAQYGLLFDYGAKIEAIMNGLPRSALPGGANFTWSLFRFFKPITAYGINYVIVHSAAFAGMYVLLKRYILNEASSHLVTVGAAFCFAILPFHPMFGLTVAGLPLLLYAFLNLFYEKRVLLSYGVIFFFGMYSVLMLTGVLVAALLFAAWLIVAIKTRRWHGRLLWGGVLLLLIYLVVERHFIYTFFFDHAFVSHRAVRREWAANLGISFAQAATLMSDNFLNGHYHAASLQRWIALLVVPFAIVLGLVTKSSEQRRESRLLLLFLGVNLLVSLTYGFENWAGLLPVKERIPFLYTFNVRLYWTISLWWYVVFALCLALIGEHKVIFGRVPGQLVVVIFLFGQALFVLSQNQEVVLPLRAAVGMLGDEDMTYAQFYSEDLFAEINAFIGRPQESYRVISLGIHPAIALHNGFYTLDGYQNNYPLAYKRQFREIIAGELAKTPVWRAYFDGWGNRAYIFSSELYDFMYSKYDDGVVDDLDLDTAVLREMGGEYILSGVEIENGASLGLVKLKTFANDTSPWRITLYQVGEAAE